MYDVCVCVRDCGCVRADVYVLDLYQQSQMLGTLKERFVDNLWNLADVSWFQ